MTTSPRSDARLAGALYLVNILLGFIAIGVIPAMLVVHGQATASVDRLQAHELLHRLGVAVHVLVVATNVPIAVLFLRLFQVVDRRLSLMLAGFLLVGAAVEAAGLSAQLTPLVVADGPAFTAAFTPAQIHALAALPLEMQVVTYSISSVPFGCYAVTAGILIARSTFLPRWIGPLMALAGGSYLTYAFATLVVPATAASLVPWVQLPSLVGELALCLSLLGGRINIARWREQSDAVGLDGRSLAID